jgi:hypothetical protein
MSKLCGTKKNNRKPVVKTVTTRKNNNTPMIQQFKGDDLLNYLKEEILHQDVAMEQLSELLFPLTLNIQKSNSDEVTLMKAVLSGNSGTGKTQTTRVVRKILGMNPGDIYENQYVEYKLGGHTDETHHNSISGSGAGYSGYGDTTLASLLLKAKIRVDPAKENPYIFIVFDELDKTKPSIMNVLNSLLDEGSISAHDNQRFVADPHTTLIIFFTSNFGAGMIHEDDPDGAIDIILDEMHHKGLQVCDTARLGDHIPYFQFDDSAIIDILIKETGKIVSNHEFTKKYGYPDINREDSITIIKKVIGRYDPSKGARDAKQLYKKEVEQFLMHSFRVFGRKIDHGSTELPLKPPAKYSCQVIPFVDGITPEEIINNYDIVRMATESSTRASKRLNTCYRERIDLDCMAMYFKNELMASSLLQPIIIHHQENHYHHHATNHNETKKDKKIIRLLEDKCTTLDNTIDVITSIVNNQDNNDTIREDILKVLYPIKNSNGSPLSNTKKRSLDNMISSSSSSSSSSTKIDDVDNDRISSMIHNNDVFRSSNHSVIEVSENDNEESDHFDQNDQNYTELTESTMKCDHCHLIKDKKTFIRKRNIKTPSGVCKKMILSLKCRKCRNLK